MPKPFTLDDVTLPPEDANKPVEFVEEGTPSPQHTEKPIPPTGEQENDKPEEPQKPSDDQKPEDAEREKKDDEHQEQKPKDEKPDSTKQELPDQKPEDKLEPFHKHPDWKKMQDRVERAEKAAEELRAQLTEKKTPEVPSKTPEERAAETVRTMAKDGHEFKDQLEMTETYNKELAKERAADQKVLDERKTIDQTNMSKEVERVTKEINLTLDELQVTKKEDRDAVLKQVQEWHEKGVSVSLQTIRIAEETLRLQGKIKADAKPKEVPNPEKDKEDKERKETAGKSTKAKPAGGGQKGNGPTFKQIREMSLDDIVLAQGEKLG